MSEEKSEPTEQNDNPSIGLLRLVADLRAAVGDPYGKLMQEELIAHCERLHHERGAAVKALRRLLRAMGPRTASGEMADALDAARDVLDRVRCPSTDEEEVRLRVNYVSAFEEEKER